MGMDVWTVLEHDNQTNQYRTDTKSGIEIDVFIFRFALNIIHYVTVQYNTHACTLSLQQLSSINQKCF